MPILINTRGLDFFGEYATNLVIANVGIIITEFAFDITGPRILNDSKEESWKAIIGNIIFAKVFLCVLIIPINLILLSNMSVELYLFESILSILLYQIGYALINQWAFICRQEIVPCAVLLTLVRLVALVSIIAFVYIVNGLKSEDVFFIHAICFFVGGLIAYFAYHKPHSQLKIGEIFSTLKVGLSVFSANIGGALISNYGNVIMAVFSDAYGVGAYNSLDRIAKFSSGLMKPIIQVIFPDVVRLERNSVQDAIKLIETQALVFLGFGCLATISFALAGEYLITVFIGRELANFHQSGVLLFLWITVGLWNNALGISGLVVLGHEKFYMNVILSSFLLLCAVTLGLSSLLTWFNAVASSLLVSETFAALLITLKYIRTRNKVILA